MEAMDQVLIVVIWHNKETFCSEYFHVKGIQIGYIVDFLIIFLYIFY